MREFRSPRSIAPGYNWNIETAFGKATEPFKNVRLVVVFNSNDAEAEGFARSIVDAINASVKGPRCTWDTDVKYGFCNSGIHVCTNFKTRTKDTQLTSVHTRFAMEDTNIVMEAREKIDIEVNDDKASPDEVLLRIGVRNFPTGTRYK